MKRFLRISLIVVLCLSTVLAVAVTATIGWRPFIGPRMRPLTDRTFKSTPERLARGQYLVEKEAVCIYCHSPHDWTKPGAPILPGMEGAGMDFNIMKGLPGDVYVPNITPDPETGAGKWTDDMLARSIREGVGHDGRALFPLMPYENYRHFPDEDVASIVVFLRSLPPVRNPLPQTALIFPVKYLIRSVPEPISGPIAPPDVSDPVKRGENLVTIAGCRDCHTPADKGAPLPNMEMAGGQVFDGPWGRVATANLTPDPSGIPYYDEALFVQAIRTGSVKARPLNPIMPWAFYSLMTDEDLKAIYAYIKTLKPIHHTVDNTEPATMCVKCNAMHGGGDKNQKN